MKRPYKVLFESVKGAVLPVGPCSDPRGSSTSILPTSSIELVCSDVSTPRIKVPCNCPVCAGVLRGGGYGRTGTVLSDGKRARNGRSGLECRSYALDARSPLKKLRGARIQCEVASSKAE